MNSSFLFKHWGTTLLLGPLASQIINRLFVLNPHQVVGLFEFYPISLLFSLILSIPTYIFYGLVYYQLGLHQVKTRDSKLILITVSALGVVLTTVILSGSMSEDIALSYSVSTIIAGLSFKLKFT